MSRDAASGVGSSDGFTLVEIAIVLVLVAVLASLALPALMRVRSSAGAKPQPPVTTPDTAPDATPPPPASRPDAVADAFARVDAALKSLPTASIAFNPNREMRVGESERVAALVSAALSAEELTAELERRAGGAGRATAVPIRIAPEMELRLTGDAFRIEPITPQRQMVGKTGAVEWSWQVSPLESGSHRLYLSVDAVLTMEGRESSRTIRVLEQPIDVRITTADRISRFTADNWQFVLGTILIPLLGWAWARRRAARAPGP